MISPPLIFDTPSNILIRSRAFVESTKVQVLPVCNLHMSSPVTVDCMDSFNNITLCFKHDMILYMYIKFNNN